MSVSLADRRPFLQARAAIARAIRDHFHALGFIEVEPPLRVYAPGGETHLEAVNADGCFLHTSPEFAMKRILSQGYDKIFYLGKVWRAGDSGLAHAEEFTMLEWYRAHAPYQVVQADCLALLSRAAEVTGARAFSFRDRRWQPGSAVQRWTMADAFMRFAGIDLLQDITSQEAMAQHCRRLGIGVQDNDTPADLYSKLLSLKVEVGIADKGAVILDEYPSQEAALAQRKPSDPRVAERFELFVCGLELANGYGELTDPIEQRARLEATLLERKQRGRTPWPIDEGFLEALAGMPPASGVALGFDRLVMLATGAGRINDVLWS